MISDKLIGEIKYFLTDLSFMFGDEEIEFLECLETEFLKTELTICKKARKLLEKIQYGE